MKNYPKIKPACVRATPNIIFGFAVYFQSAITYTHNHTGESTIQRKGAMYSIILVFHQSHYGFVYPSYQIELLIIGNFNTHYN